MTTVESFVLALVAVLVIALVIQRRLAISRAIELAGLRQDDELQRQEQRDLTAALSSATSDGLIVLDGESRVVALNLVAQSLLGAEDGVGSPLGDIAGDWALQPLVDQVLSQRSEAVDQVVMNGERAFAVRVRSAGRRSQVAAVVGLDEVTELQRLGRARRDFVANISHELRTPVTTLQVMIETLSEETLGDRAFVLDLLDKMHAQVDLLRQLTNELMDLALIESGQAPIKLVETSAAELVGEAVQALRPQAERKSVALQTTVPTELLVLADAPGIRKVLRNLIHNAIKYTPAGGRVEVCVARRQENVEFAVGDTGIGIPARDLPRVFERFYKVSRDRARGPGEVGGTGLGLAIAKHIVGAHGGQIWAESAEGKGSIFYFTLPAAD